MNQEAVYQMTLGPVQGFVGQARRTRDFWAGSFLLSWLSGVAMNDVIAQGGRIEFPHPDGNFMDAVRGELDPNRQAPNHGALPNRFKSILARVGQDFDPERVTQSITTAWRGLADLVWQQTMAPALVSMNDQQQSMTLEIWQRQVAGFWEISWCQSDAGDTELDLLQRRKNLRIHLAGDEPGVKCMMMDGYQELSGTPTPNAMALKSFWDSVRRQLNPGDLRAGECLCALALIKRVFAHYFDQLQVPLQNWSVSGWPLPTTVPSIPYLAATHWIEHAIQRSDEPRVASAWQSFFEQGKQLAGALNERSNPLRCLADLAATDPAARDWASLDGNLYFPYLLADENLFEDREVADKTARAFDQLRAQVGLSEPSPFYAVLLMDGDSLGSQMGDLRKQAKISEALNQFTSDVERLVDEHHGFLVYAGGDDVLALMPLEDALGCAAALHRGYNRAFANVNPELDTPIETSISAAVVYSHIKQPLTTTLLRAHALLDDVAKDRCGRNSLAVEVWKPGGRHLQWALPWEQCCAGEQPYLGLWAEQWRDNQDQLGKFTQGFLQRAIALLERLGSSNIDDSTCRALVVAEYRHSGLQSANESVVVDGFLSQARRYRRANSDDSTTQLPGYQTDSFKLLRFLIQKGVKPTQRRGQDG